MRKFLVTTMVGGMLTASAFVLPGAHAATSPCGDQTSQARNAQGNPTGADTLADSGHGDIVYGAGNAGTPSGYVGVTGPHGFIEASSANGGQVAGNSTESPVNGHVNGNGGVCLAGTPVR